MVEYVQSWLTVIGVYDRHCSCVKIENDLIIFGGGHAASIVIRAAKKGLLKPKAIAAVAPTWAGPLPIVFGRDSSMETRYFDALFFKDMPFSVL